MNFAAVYGKMIKDNEVDNKLKLKEKFLKQKQFLKDKKFQYRINHWAVPKRIEEKDPFFKINFHSVNDYIDLHNGEPE